MSDGDDTPRCPCRDPWCLAPIGAPDDTCDDCGACMRLPCEPECHLVMEQDDG